MERDQDFLIIGSGIAGLSLALKASKLGTVAVVTKRERFDSNTNLAQGGIASVMDATDSFENHIRDTLIAGDGLCDEKVVRLVVEDGPARIRELLAIGVEFTEEEHHLHLGKEGGHSHRRIVHAKDLTGQAVEKALLNACDREKNIKFYEHHFAIDLLSPQRLGMKDGHGVLGAYVLDVMKGEVHTFTSRATILASGGCGKVYRYTTNPDIATGDGIAMAYRAGAEIADMEFYQFHPTCLFHPKAKRFLISEAVRGEGGLLKRPDGQRFMDKYDKRGELAPRDVVARAIDAEMKKRGLDNVVLDITHKGRDFIKDHFPNIYETTAKFGFDMATEPLPVVPAAHYSCGGVRVDMNGATTVPGLFACGEVSCTGLHGANRLASNSLLEALVYAERIYRSLVSMDKSVKPHGAIPSWNPGRATEADELVVISQNWDEIRTLMWNYVGIVRTTKRLERALSRIELLRREIRDFYWDFKVTPDLLELRNIALAAEIIIRSAMMRMESRGLHYTLDYPEKDDKNCRHDTVIKKGISIRDGY